MRPIGLVKCLTKLRQLAQQTQCRARHFKDHRSLSFRDRDRRVAFDTCEQCHLTKTRAALEPADSLLPFTFANVHVDRTFNCDVEGVSTPLALTHDVFAGVVCEQPHVRTNALAVAVVASLNDYLEIGGVLLFAVLFFEKFGSERKTLDSFNDATPIGDFAWHRFVY